MTPEEKEESFSSLFIFPLDRTDKLCNNDFQFDKSCETSRIIQPKLEVEDTLENPDIPCQVPKVQGLPLKCVSAESLRQKDRMQNRYPVSRAFLVHRAAALTLILLFSSELLTIVSSFFGCKKYFFRRKSWKHF